jgi:hypothetical protein
MPCHPLSAEQHRHQERERERYMFTRFACTQLTEMERNGQPVPAEIKEWWESHKQHDKWKKQHEKRSRELRKAQKEALAKLSVSDRLALNIDEDILLEESYVEEGEDE